MGLDSDHFQSDPEYADKWIVGRREDIYACSAMFDIGGACQHLIACVVATSVEEALGKVYAIVQQRYRAKSYTVIGMKVPERR